MRVEGDRVAVLDPSEERLATRGQPEEAAVGGVGVDPEPVLARDPDDLVQGIDGARVRRAHVDDDEERPAAPRPVFTDGRLQCFRHQPEPRVCRQRAETRSREAGEAGGLRHAVVRLVRQIDRRVPEVLAESFLTGGHEGAEVRERPPRGEHASRSGRQAHQRAQPGDGRLLDLREGRGRRGHAHVAVGGGGDEVGERRGVDAPAGDVGEIARAGGVVALGDGGAETLEEAREGPARLGDGLPERRPHRLDVVEVIRGLVAEARDVSKDKVGDRAGLSLELRRVGLEREGRGVHGGIVS